MMLKFLLIGVILNFGCFANPSVNSVDSVEEIEAPKMIAFLVNVEKTPIIDEDKNFHQAPQIKRDSSPVRNRHRHLPSPRRNPEVRAMETSVMVEYSNNGDNNVTDGKDVSDLDVVKTVFDADKDAQSPIPAKQDLFYRSKKIEKLTNW